MCCSTLHMPRDQSFITNTKTKHCPVQSHNHCCNAGPLYMNDMQPHVFTLAATVRWLQYSRLASHTTVLVSCVARHRLASHTSVLVYFVSCHRVASRTTVLVYFVSYYHPACHTTMLVSFVSYRRLAPHTTVWVSFVSCHRSQFAWHGWSPVHVWILTNVATSVSYFHNCGNVGLLCSQLWQRWSPIFTIVAMLLFCIRVDLHSCGSVGLLYKCDWIFTFMTPFALVFLWIFIFMTLSALLYLGIFTMKHYVGLCILVAIHLSRRMKSGAVC